MWPFKKKQPEPSRIQVLLDKMEQHPEEFTADEYCLKHTKSGVEIWLANGEPYYGLYKPFSMKFSYADNERFHKALHRWKMASIQGVMEQLK